MASRTVLVTGGAGYIGSHTCIELLNEGYNVISVDNYVNSSPVSLERVQEITGKSMVVYEVDLLNTEALENVFVKHQKIDAVVHFAALKAVGESVQKPLEYYQNNLVSLLNLLEVMKKHNCKKIIFSSSATVYGLPDYSPIPESAKLDATNPYGRTKLFIEKMLEDLSLSDPDFQIVILRYFNPAGAHASGRIGEDPRGIPNNLMPYITQVATGKRDKLRVFGNDYDTRDGTGVRDYIHVVDLAKGHVAAIVNGLYSEEKTIRCEVYNLGTGNGFSVLELVQKMEEASGRPIPYEITARRPGDVGEVFADAKKAYEELKWQAIYGIDEICRDAWKWQSGNPNGYQKLSINVLFLCAGYGTRLQRDIQNDSSGKYSSLLNLPKALLPVGGVPLLTRWMDILREASCDGYKINQDGVFVVTNAVHLSQFQNWAVQNNFPSDHVINDGTTCNEQRFGAVKDKDFVLSNHEILKDHPLLVIGGDTIFAAEFSLSDFLSSLIPGISKVLSYPTESTTRTGILETDDRGIVTGFLEKPNPNETSSRQACPCFYLLSPESFHLLHEYVSNSSTLNEVDTTGSFIRWLYPRHRIETYSVSGRFDVGALDSYIETDSYFSNH